VHRILLLSNSSSAKYKLSPRPSRDGPTGSRRIRMLFKTSGRGSRNTGPHNGGRNKLDGISSPVCDGIGGAGQRKQGKRWNSYWRPTRSPGPSLFGGTGSQQVDLPHRATRTWRLPPQSTRSCIAQHRLQGHQYPSHYVVGGGCAMMRHKQRRLLGT
jgi:hypothetical protein